MADLRPIYIFDGIVHPDRKDVFREDAAPKSMVKEGRKEAIRACSKCGKTGGDGKGVKKCAGCGFTFYCSQECQREHWPFHKLNCSSELGGGIQSLIRSVTGNPMISHYIQVCIALQFSLHRLPPSKRQIVSRAPLSVQIDVGIEPTMIGDFMALYTYPDEWEDKDDLEGMLQFHQLTPPDAWEPPRTLSPSELAIWKQARESADECGESQYAVVMVQFVNNFKQRITCPFTVGEEALGQARRNMPFTVGSAITGKMTDKPLTIANCFEYLNTHIRADKKDQLLLRAPMRPCDKELIRDAGRCKDGHAPQMLLRKIRHEGVYVSYSAEFVNEAAAAREAEAAARNNGGIQQQDDDGNEEREEDQARQAPQAPKPPMNRAERRRLEREMKKEAKRRK